MWGPGGRGLLIQEIVVIPVMVRVSLWEMEWGDFPGNSETIARDTRMATKSCLIRLITIPSKSGSRCGTI